MNSSTPLAGTALEEHVLDHPVEVIPSTNPQIGQVWRFDGSGRFRFGGRNRSAVTMVMPERIPKGIGLDKKPIYQQVLGINFAIDYTSLPLYPMHRLEQTWSGENADVLREVRQNIEANETTPHRYIQELVGKDPRKVWVLVATGPSLNNTAHLVAQLDRSKVAVVAMNSAVDKVGRENVDYHFGLDRRFKAEWGKGCHNITAVMHPQVPKAALAEYKEIFFYGHPGRGHACESIRAFYDHYLHGVGEFEQAANVGPTAMHFAHAMGAEVIIWLGLDCGWSKSGETHWKKDVNGVDYSSDNVTVQMLKDGKAIAEYESKREYIQAAHYTFGHAYWLQQAGIRVVNCTGWGIFYDHALTQQPWANYERANIHGVTELLPPCEPVKFEDAIEALRLWR